MDDVDQKNEEQSDTQQKDDRRKDENKNEKVDGNSSIENPELDALLDDALLDFEKPLKKASSNRKPQNESKLKLSTESLGENSSLDDTVAKALEEIQANMQNMQQFMNGVDSSGMTGGGETTEDLMQAMENMMKDGSLDSDDFMKNMDLPPEFMNMATGGMPDLEGADGFLGAMQGMMNNLLSKELLYPSLSEIRSKYPSWLASNSKHPDIDKYTKQHLVVEQLCKIFEAEKDSDEESVKSKRKTDVIELMQKMQSYGQPPEDMMENVVGDIFEGVPTGINQEECCIM